MSTALKCLCAVRRKCVDSPLYCFPCSSASPNVLIGPAHPRSLEGEGWPSGACCSRPVSDASAMSTDPANSLAELGVSDTVPQVTRQLYNTVHWAGLVSFAPARFALVTQQLLAPRYMVQIPPKLVNTTQCFKTNPSLQTS